MPVFVINTNLPKDKIPADFVKTTAQVVASTLGKPLSYVVVHVNPDQMLGWGGGSEPCAYASLGSIGCIGKEANKKHSAALFKHIESQLGIPGDKLYITYVNLDKADVGYAGQTFDDLM